MNLKPAILGKFDSNAAVPRVITLTLLHPIKQIPIQVWTFPNESVIRIGRSTDNQVVLYSAVVSRHHVELRCIDRHWQVVNLGTNGTYLDGKRITQETVTDGAIIRLARSGPNIQIRMGEAGLKDLSDSNAMARSSPPRSELPLIPTEITGEHPEHEAEQDPEVDFKETSSTAATVPVATVPAQIG